MTFRGFTIGVSIPAHNEEKLITETILGIPVWVDWIVIINDQSMDGTQKVVEKLILEIERNIFLINNKKNIGVGGSIIRGHDYLMKQNCDILVVMAGDNQMDPNYLGKLLKPITNYGFDYSKGNRFFKEDSLTGMPKFRIFGNYILSFLSKVGSGYWSIFDPQNGYTAIWKEMYGNIEKSNLQKGYNFENSMLTELNIQNASVADIYIPARYNQEKSGIKIPKFIVSNIYFQFVSFFRRINKKYLSKNFHPLGITYLLGLFLTIIGFIDFIYIFNERIIKANLDITYGSYFLLFFIIGSGLILLKDSITNEIQQEQNNIIIKQNQHLMDLILDDKK